MNCLVGEKDGISFKSISFRGTGRRRKGEGLRLLIGHAILEIRAFLCSQGNKLSNL